MEQKLSSTNIASLVQPYIAEVKLSGKPLILAELRAGLKFQIVEDGKTLVISPARLSGESSPLVPVTDHIWVWCDEVWPDDVDIVRDTIQLARRESYCRKVNAFSLNLQHLLETRVFRSERKFEQISTPYYSLDQQQYTVDNIPGVENVFVQRAINNQGRDIGRWRLIKRIPVEEFISEFNTRDRTASLLLFSTTANHILRRLITRNGDKPLYFSL